MLKKIKALFRRALRGFSILEFMIYAIIIGGACALLFGILKPRAEVKAAIMEIRTCRYSELTEKELESLRYFDKQLKLKKEYAKLLDSINTELAKSKEPTVEAAQ